jgi:hypothetical protein
MASPSSYAPPLPFVVTVVLVADCVLEPVWIQEQPDQDTELTNAEKDDLVDKWNHTGQLPSLQPAHVAGQFVKVKGESCRCHPHVVRLAHSKLHDWTVDDMVEMHLAVDTESMTPSERRERETWYQPFGRIQKLFTLWFRDDAGANVFHMPALPAKEVASDDDEGDDEAEERTTLSTQWAEIRYGYFGADIDRRLHASLRRITGQPVRRQTMFWSDHEQALPLTCLTRRLTHDEDFQTRFNAVEWTYHADVGGNALESGQRKDLVLLTRERPVEFSGNGRRLGITPVVAAPPAPAAAVAAVVAEEAQPPMDASVFARDLLADIKEPPPASTSSSSAQRKRKRLRAFNADAGQKGSDDEQDETYDPMQDDIGLESEESEDGHDNRSVASAPSVDDEDRPILDMLPPVARRRSAKAAKRDAPGVSSAPAFDDGPAFLGEPIFGGSAYDQSSNTSLGATFETRFRQFVQVDDAFMYDTPFWMQDILPVLFTLANCNNNLPHVWSHLWKSRFNLHLADSYGRRNWCGESTCFFCKKRQPLTSEYVDAETGVAHPVGSTCAAAVRAATDVMHDMRQFRKQARTVARSQSQAARDPVAGAATSAVAVESSFHRPLLPNPEWQILYAQARRTLQVARDVRAM